MPFRIEKVVSALPGSLTADTIYFVRVGTGFDIYVTNSVGLIAHTLNAPISALTVETQTANYTTVQGDFGKYMIFTGGTPTLYDPIAADVGKSISFYNNTGGNITLLSSATLNDSATISNKGTITALVTAAGEYNLIGGE